MVAVGLKRRLERSLRRFGRSNEEANCSLEKQCPAPCADSAGKLTPERAFEQDEPTRRVQAKESVARRRQLNAFNSMAAIKLKMLLPVLAALLFLGLHSLQPAQAGFYTFYFPNILKPKGFGELTDMIHKLDAEINVTRDAFADTEYFWGQLRRLDSTPSDYPEESACSEVFPLFRELAISYIYVDFKHYLKPFELYRQHLVANRNKWYPAGLESKAALPREWEQNLHERELELKIEWLERLATSEAFKSQRNKMVEIWRNVRRSLDTSLPCIYLRYAYRQMAEDINQVALEENLQNLNMALRVLRHAYKRIEAFRVRDQAVVEDIEEELKKLARFTINDAR